MLYIIQYVLQLHAHQHASFPPDLPGQENSNVAQERAAVDPDDGNLVQPVLTSRRRRLGAC